LTTQAQQVFADVLEESSGMKAELQILPAGALLENYAKLEAALRNLNQLGRINQLIEN
jgi:hypothetical protein